MKNDNAHRYFLILTFFVLFMLTRIPGIHAQNLATEPEKKVIVVPSADEIAKLRSAVESNPSDLKAHQAYIKAVGVSEEGIEKQYDAWMKKFPGSAVIPFALGEAYTNTENPKAKPWLLKAVSVDPKHSLAYKALWSDAARWGDFAGGRQYLAKAVEADPTNPDVAFYYANEFDDVDFEKYTRLSLEVAKNFPTHERGAQALYWLAHRGTVPENKIAAWEQLRNQFSPDKFSWSSSGMSSYFDFLLLTDPAKAIELGESISKLDLKENQKKSWASQITLAQKVHKAKQLIAEKKAAEATEILKDVKVPSYSKFVDELAILKSKAADESGNTMAAYDSLAGWYAKSPTDRLGVALKQYAAKLGRSEKQINADILKIHEAAAEPATAFTLEQYVKSGPASLSDFKGKVVLITYWFPGCGPCRAEFPHFENVVKKFKGQDFVYLALNIVPEQDEYVIPFIKSSGYSFTPLRDVKGREKGNLNNRNAAPVNFLIDKDGKLVFSRFRTDANNERTLELMITALLKGKAI